MSPYSYGDFHAADRKNDVADLRDSRRVLERDMHAQASLERLEEENSSLRAITRYLIHERKELRRKADTAAKRNQNLNNLLQVIKWSLLQGGANACGGSAHPPPRPRRLCPCLRLSSLSSTSLVLTTLSPKVEGDSRGGV